MTPFFLIERVFSAITKKRGVDFETSKYFRRLSENRNLKKEEKIKKTGIGTKLTKSVRFSAQNVH